MRLLTLILLVGILSGCSREQPAVSDAAQTFVFARGSDAQKLDPADVDDGESVNTLAQICEGLVRFKSGTLEVEACLAESYSVSDDGLVYTFQIREGVRFHDGLPLDAKAAAFSFRRQMDPGHPAHLEQAAYAYWNYLYQEVETVEASGPMTLEIRLSKPNASLLRSLAVFPAWLISPLSFEAHGAQMQRQPIGTGPYKFVQWRPNEVIVMERNEDYWDGAPQFERLVMKVVPDNTSRLLQLKSGDIQGMDGLQPTEIAALEEDPAVDVYRESGLNVAYLAFNLESERISIPEVRKAIAFAIDRDRFAEVALEGAGRPASYPLPAGFLGYPETEEPIPNDVERARALAAPYLGLFAEDPLEIVVMTAPRPYLPDPVTAASFIRAQIEAIGIPTKVVALDFKTQLDRLRNAKHELGLIGWVGDNGDSDNFLGVFFGSWAAKIGSANNFSFYRNPEMDEYLLAARRASMEAERHRLYAEVLTLWRRDLPILPLCHGDNVVAISSGFEGFTLQKIGDLRLGEIRSRAQ